MLKECIDALPEKPRHVAMPDQVLEYFRQHHLPPDIIDDLVMCSFDEWVAVGAFDLIPMPQFLEETEGIAMCVEHGVIPIAGCPNFDAIVVDCKTRRMSFLSHDTLWSDEWKSIGECLQETPFLYEDFWRAMLQDPSFPTDYYEAEERWANHKHEFEQ